MIKLNPVEVKKKYKENYSFNNLSNNKTKHFTEKSLFSKTGDLNYSNNIRDYRANKTPTLKRNFNISRLFEREGEIMNTGVNMRVSKKNVNFNSNFNSNLNLNNKQSDYEKFTTNFNEAESIQQNKIRSDIQNSMRYLLDNINKSNLDSNLDHNNYFNMVNMDLYLDKEINLQNPTRRETYSKKLNYLTKTLWEEKDLEEMKMKKGRKQTNVSASLFLPSIHNSNNKIQNLLGSEIEDVKINQYNSRKHINIFCCNKMS